ncbi:50S ribosomal protein L17 [Prevotella sp. CAG:1031]|nr:50S ribosomal protein L17 [Prevotella sp. CAG:1031]
MRHNKKFNHLSRKKAHRDALLANMTIALIMRKRIFTTLAKAKALRVYAEPLINRAKADSTPNRRHVFAHLQDKAAVTELFNEISNKIADRPGGYTRILKTGNRLGDNASMCFIELVDYNEAAMPEKAAKKTATRRSRRSPKKAVAEAAAKADKEHPAAEEAPKAE